MDGWIFCEDDFIQTDILRWKEAVWEKRGPREGRSVCIGERLLTAEVIAEEPDTGFVTLLVRDDGCWRTSSAKNHPSAEEGQAYQAQTGDAQTGTAGADGVERRGSQGRGVGRAGEERNA